ncbi:uncharacterized protein CXQ87_004007 [Candidozyma duobushaemuli]|uniref:DNA damage checkpoint protein LCD1 n=1 Tax=Candidozyma duobushaemuli TaxID=1231522 RepID=A0A2V1AFY1_9ASCO|nr:uncharacterized protein CXQ87_004007 [[Candida] duobushaemulonis]PVH16143.1 hypothetical protein CXQ87_004007 [[Candida] duobushaemulonis]
MSDDGFDDDDHLLMELVRATQKPEAPLANTTEQRAQNPSNNGTLKPIAILRAQLQSLQSQKTDELTRLQNQLESARLSGEAQANALKQSVQRLEDEKKFLGNEVRALSASKRRKIDVPVNTKDDSVTPAPPSHHFVHNIDKKPDFHAPSSFSINVKDDWSQFCNHIWNSTILGSSRTDAQFLDKIWLEAPITVEERVVVPVETSLMSCIWSFILRHRDARLDNLVFIFCEYLVHLIQELLSRQNSALAVPFLLSLINSAINFKTGAVSEKLVLLLTTKLASISDHFSHLLDWTFEADDPLLTNHGKTYQQQVLERFTITLLFDVIENATVIATQYGADFVKSLWTDSMDVALVLKLLPENTERFKSAAQTNLLYNFVEMLSSSLIEDGIAIRDEKLEKQLVSSLIKVFLIDVEIKEDSMFYGLNRPLGSNLDFAKILQMVPSDPYENKLDKFERFEMLEAHEHHLLSLRLRIASFLETLIMSPSGNTMEIITCKESMKSIVRIIALEQNQIIHQPRSKHVHMRISIVAIFLKILYFIAGEFENINTIIYPETLYELFVVLMRIAFGSDHLSQEATRLLTKIRAEGHVHVPVFNKWCELRASQVAHFNVYEGGPDKFDELAAIETDFANGLEVPYEQDTVEIAREILSLCVNHDEADNLYFNMNYEEV